MFEYIIITLLVLLGGLGWFLLWKASKQLSRLESFVVDINESIGEFYSKISSLFDMNIHYYDDTIFQFIEDTKRVKHEIDNVVTEYEDLNEYFFPDPEKAPQESEVLGVSRPLIYNRKLPVGEQKL